MFCKKKLAVVLVAAVIVGGTSLPVFRSTGTTYAADTGSIDASQIKFMLNFASAYITSSSFDQLMSLPSNPMASKVTGILPSIVSEPVVTNDAGGNLVIIPSAVSTVVGNINSKYSGAGVTASDITGLMNAFISKYSAQSQQNRLQIISMLKSYGMYKETASQQPDSQQNSQSTDNSQSAGGTTTADPGQNSNDVQKDKVDKVVKCDGEILEKALTDIKTLSSANAQLKLVGDLYKVTLTADSDGTQLGLSVDTSVYSKNDILKIGLYSLTEDGKLNYQKVKLNNTNSLSIKVKSNGYYGLFAYNKNFNDVTEKHWAKDAIDILAAKHIVNGVDDSKGLFKPDGYVTKAEFAAFVVRALELKSAEYKGLFNDVDKSKWYAQEVEAAKSAGIIGGDSKSNFYPDKNITREEMATIVAKAYIYQQESSIPQILNLSAGKVSFKDSSNISKWAADYVNAAKITGIISGMTDGSFQPKQNATRAQAVKIIYMLMDKTAIL